MPGDALSVKRPSASVMVLLAVPFCWIVAPTKGSPLASFTVPDTCFVAVGVAVFCENTMYLRLVMS